MSPVLAVTDRATWDAALLQLPLPHILQTWDWGETKAQTGWRSRRLLWLAGERPVAAAALLVRRVAGTPLGVAYVPKGPLLDWQDAALAGDVLARLEQEARACRAMFLKIDPDVRADTPLGAAVVARLAGRGWHSSPEQIQFRNTMISDLSPEEETLLARMKPKWRYNIRLAERRGINVRCGTEADLPVFYAMYRETGRRDGFLVRPYAYYQRIWATFLGAGWGHLLLAEASGRPVAGLILFRFGPTAWYFYGASTAEARPLMPNHALQWAALRWAKSAGCLRYDWWGAPDRLHEQAPMWGVYQFKAGFGGEFVPGIGAYDYVVSRPLYWAYAVAMPRLLDLARRRQQGRGPADGSREEASQES